MFHPLDHPMERGWVGRVDGEHVVELAAQTLPAFFTGGGGARKHAVFPLSGVQLLAPVLHPPAVRIFEDEATFAFANPAAIVGPGSEVRSAEVRGSRLLLLPRLAAVIGADAAIGGLTCFAEWRDPARTPPKDRDFALGLGPVVVTPDELAHGVEIAVRVDGAERLREHAELDWSALRALAADGTRLRPGDLLAGPAVGELDVPAGSRVEIEATAVGVLDQAVVS